jgi:hypothetical protein
VTSPVASRASSAAPVTFTSQKQRLEPRRRTRASAIRSWARAAATKSTVRPTVVPRGGSPSNSIADPGGGHRRGVDQGGRGAAVDDVADRHDLRGEGEGEDRVVVLDRAQPHPEVADERGVLEEGGDALCAAHHFGGIRSAPSRRIVSPFSIGLATIC